jgi:hypothetical protein
MELPGEVQQAIKQAHGEMLADSFHTLLPKQRVPIYRATEILEQPILWKFRAWLAILTARKVLPVWEEELPGDDLAQRILEVSEGMLAGKLTNLETQYERGSLQRAVGNSEQFIESDRARAALLAAYSALKAVLGYSPFEKLSRKQIEHGFPDEKVADIWGDTAGLAVLAYSGFAYKSEAFSEETYVYNRGKIDIIPKNKPQALLLGPASFLKKVFVREKKEGTGYFHRSGLNLNKDFEPELRKEFWEWWLFEAIPKAWDLAHQSSLK